MREWLDHHRFEPAKFLYTFVPSGILFQVDFPVEADAIAFAREFSGRVIAAPADRSLQAADRQMAEGCRTARIRAEPMHIYRCFFLDEGDHIKAAEISRPMRSARRSIRHAPCCASGLSTVPSSYGRERESSTGRMDRRDRIEPKPAELSRAETMTILFLRMAAIEMRHIAHDAGSPPTGSRGIPPPGLRSKAHSVTNCI